MTIKTFDGRKPQKLGGYREVPPVVARIWNCCLAALVAYGAFAWAQEMDLLWVPLLPLAFVIMHGKDILFVLCICAAIALVTNALVKGVAQAVVDEQERRHQK